MDSSFSLESGIYVVQITADGPAKKTELTVGDVITKIDGIEINKMSELRSYIYNKKPGELVTLSVNRNNKEYSISIKLSKK